uniref:Sugar ABC transporter permease n=1 Tax=uncultured bacterium Contig20b TaxID=1393534 RepID=W0FKG4_9BACT|nr:sugar ABC transporter permease [uncultured bacterium Contig20b]
MKNRVKRNHWYEGITEAVQMYIPGNKVYRTIQARRARTGTLFILPLIIGFLLFMVRPLYLSFLMSLSKVVVVEGTMSPFNINLNLLGKNLVLPLGNYNYAFVSDPDFNKMLVDEIGRMAINTIATLVMSFVIAVILNQNFKGRTICRIIFFLPVILSSGVLPGIESQNAYFNLMTSISDAVGQSSGVDLSKSLQQLLSVSGVAQNVFDVIFQMIDSIYDIVMASGIQIIVFLTGLQSISPSLYEAAEVEGCSAWESFWKITFPMVSPLLLVNCIYTIIDFFMKNDNKVMEHINEVMYGTQMDFGAASAESWIYFGVALVFIGISTFIITRAVKSYE